ncbi:transposase [Lysinibacillus sp. FSL K6-0232]
MFKDYNMNQLVLPLDVEIKLQENDIAFSIHQLVESIPSEAFAPFLQQTGCPAYHPRMMLKLILCGYTQSAFSGRRIEDLTKDSLRMMWLAQGYQPSYRTINRFRVHPLTKELLRQCFVQFRCQLVKEDLIAQEAIFIDGTKIEANANKFTFVWKRSIEKYEASLVEKSNQLYEELLQQQIIPAIEQEVETQLSITELKQVAEKLEEVVADYTERIEQSEEAQERKQLRSERKTPKQQWKQVNEWITRKQKYEQDFAIFGKRNSYAKAGTLYRQRKVDIEPVFGCLKANLGFTHFSVLGQSKVENEIGFALMAVNLRKYGRKRKFSANFSTHTSKNRNHLMRFRFFVWTRTIYVPASS